MTQQFKRSPITKMLIAEANRTTHALPKAEEGDRVPQTYLSPIGRTISKVLIMGTAVDSEDRGGDSIFWTLRVADPSGSMSVTAGQYQPEAARCIAELQPPQFVMVTGKLHIYEPESGQKIVSIKAETIRTVSKEIRDSIILDTGLSTLKEINVTDQVKEIYGDTADPEAFKMIAQQAIESLLDGKEIPVTKEQKENKKEKLKEPGSIKDIKDFIIEITQEQDEVIFDNIPDLLREKDVNPGMIDWGAAIKELIIDGRVYESEPGIIRYVE